MEYSIKQISEMAGVSPSTVSKALNGQKGVSEQKRKEILSLARTMKYRPNANARALAHQKTESIGLIVPPNVNFTLSGLYWSEIIAAIAEEANKRNYSLLLIMPNQENPLRTIENAILKRTVDGVIVPAEHLTQKELSLLQDYEVPFVIQGRSVLSDSCSVDVRNEEGAQKLAQRLVAKGFRHICCLAGPERYLYTQERVRGFKAAMAQGGLPIPQVVYTEYDRESTVQSARLLVEQNPQMDALFVSAGGEFIFYIIETLTQAGVDMKKLHIATFDDYLPFRYLPYHIIAARQPIHEMGTQDARNLFQLIDKEPAPSLSLFDVHISG